MTANALSPASGARDWPRSLLAILGAGVAIRVLLWLWFAPLAPHIDDELAHLKLARNIAANGTYTFDTADKPTSLRPPLYPAFVAVVFECFGTDNFQAVRLIQSVLSLFTVVVLFRFGRNFLSEKAGLRAAGMMCFYPTFLGYNNLILTETLFTLWLVSGLYSLSRGLSFSSYRALAIAGVVLGLGALTRSILYPFAPILAVFLFATWRGSALRRVAAAAAFTLPFGGVLAPWAIRNTQLQGTFIPVDCMGGRNFMMGNYEHTPLYRSWDAISIQGEREWFRVLLTHRPEVSGSSQGQVDKHALAEGVHFIKQNPGLTAQRDAVKFLDYWGLERELVAGAAWGYFGPIPRPGIVAMGVVICGSYAVILFAGAFGTAIRPVADSRVHLLLLLTIAFMCGVHTVVFAHSRYHLPGMPLIMLYAAAFISSSGPARRRRPEFWAALGFCAIVVGGWVWTVAAGDSTKLLSILGGSE